MEPKLNYVIAAWSGSRRTLDPQARVDPAYYLREHFASLASLRHRLARVTVCVPHNPDEPPEFAEFRRTAPRTLGTAEVVWLDRPNVGMSYGSWSDAYLATAGQFTHYVLMEDDYRFCLDGFDDILVAMLCPGDGFLCGMVRDESGPHPAVALGIAPEAALAAIVAKDQKLPHSNNALYADAERLGQIGWGGALRRAGFALRDWMRSHRTAFRYSVDKACYFGESEGPVLIGPVGNCRILPLPEPGDPVQSAPPPPPPPPRVPRRQKSREGIQTPGVGGRRGLSKPGSSQRRPPRS